MDTTQKPSRVTQLNHSSEPNAVTHPVETKELSKHMSSLEMSKPLGLTELIQVNEEETKNESPSL